MVYMPGFNVTLPAENSNGISTSTLLGACACTPATASPKKTAKIANNLYRFFITNYLQLLNATVSGKRAQTRISHKKAQKAQNKFRAWAISVLLRAVIPRLLSCAFCAFLWL